MNAVKTFLAKALGWLVVLIIGLVVLHAAGSAGHSDGDHCEQMWAANRATADNEYMSHDRYVRNCHQTDDDIRDGLFDK